MSRVDITINNKNTNELVTSRGFCRTPALKFLCEESLDEKLQDFDYDVGMGIDLDKENILNFLEKIQYVIESMENISSEYKQNHFTDIDQVLYLQFIENLQKSKAYLEGFVVDRNLDDYSILIV